MSQHHPHSGPCDHGNHQKPHGRKLHQDWRMWAIVLLMLAAMAVYLLTLDERIGPGGNPAPASPPPATVPATNVPPVAAVTSGFLKLKGKWLRPDGGYIIEVKDVDGGGKLDAAYFNPRPIHVAKAEASLKGDATRVFIELRDVNYPGSTYTLTYNPERDQLAGIYYQAVQREKFDVVFVRTD